MLSGQQKEAWYGPGTGFEMCGDCGDVFSSDWPDGDLVVKEHKEPWHENTPVWQCFTCSNLEGSGFPPYHGVVSYGLEGI